jgi:hypothetical protein
LEAVATLFEAIVTVDIVECSEAFTEPANPGATEL